MPDPADTIREALNRLSLVEAILAEWRSADQWAPGTSYIRAALTELEQQLAEERHYKQQMQIAANDAIKVREDLQQLAQSYPQGALLRATEQPFWREIKPFYGRATNLQDVSISWLEQLHG